MFNPVAAGQSSHTAFALGYKRPESCPPARKPIWKYTGYRAIEAAHAAVTLNNICGLQNHRQSRFTTRSHRGAVTTRALVGASVVVVGAILVLSWRGNANKSRTSTAPVPPVPDITQLPVVTGGNAMNNMGVGEGLFISIADKRDPTRVAGQLSATKSTPLEGRRYEMEQPRVWIYLRDGRTVYFEAESGRALLPDLAGARPEDGLIKGKVRGRMFAPTQSGERPDPATAQPILVLQTEELTFDLRVGEVRFPYNVTLTGDRVDFAGSRVLLVLTEGEQRLEQLRVESTQRLVIFPQGRAATGNRNIKSTATARVDTPVLTNHALSTSSRAAVVAVSQPAPRSDNESMYSVTMENRVHIRQGARWVRAGNIESLVRLIDNAIPKRDAIPATKSGSVGTQPSQTAVVATSSSNNNFVVTPASYAPPAKKNGQPAAQPIEFTFEGPMEARMLTLVPDQLKASDAWVRAVGDDNTYVTLGDDDGALVASAREAWYSTTLKLAGLVGTAAKPAVLTKKDTGAAAGESFEVNQRTGSVIVNGGGWLESLGKAAVNRLAWNSRAEFIFAVVRGEMTSRLDSADIHGSVRGTVGTDDPTRPAGELGGENVTANFAAIDDTTSYLHSLVVRGKNPGVRASANDGKGGNVTADLLSVLFTRGAGTQSDPTHVEATGAVEAKQNNAVLTAANVKATISRITQGPQGESTLRATDVVASNNVMFDRGDGVRARTPRLAAKPVEQTIVLSGPGSEVAQHNTTISGNTVTMNGLARTIAVEGAGEFNHLPQADVTKDGPARTARATWSRAMTFDDGTGILVCDGNARAELATSATTTAGAGKDTLVAESVKVALEKSTAQPEVNNQAVPGRRVLYGEANATTGALGTQIASVEVRRYSLTSPDVLERLMFIEGTSIRADNQRGKLDVSSAGKLLTLDRSGGGDVTSPQPEEQNNNNSRVTSQMNAKGTALFVWNESMTFDRASGEAVFLGSGERGVRLVHQSLSGGRAELECKVLTAMLDTTQSGEGFTSEFRSARAVGYVWLRAAQREMTADTLEYAAATRTAQADANPGNVVLVTNPGSASPIAASSLTWNLATDSVSVRNAQPMTAPR